MRKRVWKPLDVGGLRLYEVGMYFNQHPEWNKKMIVAAKKPTHASFIVEEIYKDTEFIEKPYFIGTALNILIPASWWEEGTPEMDYLILLQEIQNAITFETEEQAKASPYGLPIELVQKIKRCVSSKS